ncbi:MAG: glutamine--tRNA ligase/YqeY domain fusion protein [Pseudomonadales bacterium]|nr:glutamine--tRNA ligase/YqeY domain fusion protein [Pseudomonadales bacterium]
MSETPAGLDFIRQRISEDVAAGSRVITRFPPEPNGRLHIGHAKSICLNFGVAAEFGGLCYLRFDDTNPEKENEAFVQAIQEDVRWLGFDWGDHLTHASDYFEQLFQLANQLISANKAFVCGLSAEEMRETRGTLTEPGVNSPSRDLSVAENLALFREMREGKHGDGSYVLRAKIDMSSPNINMRDPVLYRIRHVHHQRTGNDWCIYPTYDYTHCVCDALEEITHSLCTLEFEDHRPLYDWVLDNINLNVHPPQIEFSRLGLEYTVMSKRLLNKLVSEQHVAGWDDPRMPTISGLRRKGVRAPAIRDFCERIGITKQNNTIEMSLFDFCVRKDLEADTHRAMCVLEPLKVVITNWTEDTQGALSAEPLTAPWHPKKDLGRRVLPFSKEIFIERSDFEEVRPRKYKRLSPGEMVRLRMAFIIRCDEVIKDDAGNIQELHCTYFPESRSGSDKSGLKPKGVVHWVSAMEGQYCDVRLYENLFLEKQPDVSELAGALNPASFKQLNAIIEPAALLGDIHHFQFERQGYFVKDETDSSALKTVFNRTVTLRDIRPG